MTQQGVNPDKKPMVKVAPTKAFFVSMLTKDIELSDAILDLIDNCLDGVLRLTNGGTDYSSYHAHIDITKDLFSITDNCGGIERTVAMQYAFRMGRDPTDDRDQTIETIGMYGIGMKRAIFKMGVEAEVRTRFDNDCYSVFFTEDWMNTNTWDDLPLIECERADVLSDAGTRIEVSALHDSVSKAFSDSTFESGLQKAIADHFTTFLERGFTIILNKRPIRPSLIKVLIPTPPNEWCKPYYAQDKVGETIISVIVGVNARIYRSTSDEDDDPTEITEHSLPEAGWTVFCNDRAVLVGDKSRLTGWGILYPSFHPQFSVLTGMVHFKAKAATDLPITTTKRALDTSSQAWLAATAMMKNAMKPFIQYTTSWKNVGRKDQRPFFAGAASVSNDEAAHLLAVDARTKTPDSSHPYYKILDPKKEGLLPKPTGKKSNLTRIAFSRPKDEVSFLAGIYFPEEEWKPAEVGETCFEKALEMHGHGQKK